MSVLKDSIDKIRAANYGGYLREAVGDALEAINENAIEGDFTITGDLTVGDTTVTDEQLETMLKYADPGVVTVSTLVTIGSISANGQTHISIPLGVGNLTWTGMDQLVVGQKYLGILNSGIKYTNSVNNKKVLLSGLVLTAPDGTTPNNIITPSTSGPNPVNMPMDVFLRGWVDNLESEALSVSIHAVITMIPIA